MSQSRLGALPQRENVNTSIVFKLPNLRIKQCKSACVKRDWPHRGGNNFWLAFSSKISTGRRTQIHAQQRGRLCGGGRPLPPF